MPKLRLVRVLKCLPVALAAVVSLPSVAQNLSAVSLSPTSVTGGTSSTGTVTLSANAPTGGKVVTLSSGNTAAATVPSSVTVAAGTKTKTFTVTTVPQAADASAVVSAAMSGVTKTATLTVKAPAMSAASVSPTSVTGGVGATLTVTLTGNAPAAGTTVTLTSGNTAAATLPASVVVSAGTKTKTAAVATSAVDANASVALTAAAGGVSKSATLTVARPVLASLALSPTTIPGGGTASGTVTLSGPAGPSGATVALSSSDAAAATVPATVPVAAGQSSGVFSVSGGVVASDRTARISATWASQTRQADLVVTRSIGRLTGSVTDVATGAPLPSARVQLQADPGLETWTDDLGRFELADVPAGAHAVVASLERYSTVTSASVVVSGGQAVAIPPVALTPLTGTLFGTVVDFANGSAPLAGVTVTEATGLHTATTDAAGAFELAGLAPGVTFLVFRKEGYRPAVSWLLDVDGDFRRQVEQGMEPTSAEFSAGRIDGVVRDGSGAPVEGASVSVVGHEELAAVTGADGRYVLSVPPAAGWIVSATKAGHARAFSNRLNASAGTEPYHLAVDLVLPPEGSTGTLELRTFDPVGRAPFRSDFWFRTPVGVWHTPVPVAGSRTIAGVPAGQVWDCLGRRVLAPGQTLTVRCVGEPVVPPGTPRWAAAGMVANRYTAEPVAGATVTFVNGPTSIPLVTDENGLFSVVSAPVGEWSAAVSGAGFLEGPAWTFTATDDPQNGAFYGATFWPERPPGTLHIASPAEGDLITGPELSVAVGFAPDRPADQLLRVRPWASAGSVRGFTTVYSPDGLGASVAIDGDFPNGPLAVTIDAVSQTGATLSTVRTVEIRRPSHPTAVAVSPAIAPAAGVATGTVVVDPPAPAGGVLVQLSSSIPSVEPPPSVTVAEGATTATFPVVVGDLGTTTVAVITAAAAGFEATAMLTVHPSSPAPLDTDLAEGSPAGWTAFADPPASASVSLDATHVKAGAAALRFVTDSGFDCGVRYSLSPGVHWDLRGIRFLTFWSRGETAEAFQGEQPVVVLRGPGGSIRYQPPAVETANGEWRFHRVPLCDASDWIVTTEGEPSLGLVTSLEIHQDVWGAGMTVAYDGIAFVSQVSEDLAEGTAPLWRTFASDGAASSVVDDSAETRSGASALRFDTASGFDTGLVFPAPTNVRWDLSDVRTLTFWVRAENTEAFQGNQPVVVLRSPAGSIRLEPGDVLLGTPGWRFFEVPLDGAFPWARTQEGTPDLANVTGIEIHADTWGYGFRLRVDGVSVGRSLPLLALPADSAPEGSAFPATIHLSAAAPAGGRVVLLETSDPAVASIPASVLVPEGARSVSFNVSIGAVAAPTSVVLTATDRGASVHADLRVTPVVDVASLTLAAASVVGGLPVAATVTLAAPAIEGGVSVLLTSSDPSSASAPAAVTVPASGTTASFSVTTLPVASDRTVTLTAGAGGISKSASLAVLVPPPPIVSGLTLNPATVEPGNSFTISVALAAPAPVGGVVVALSAAPEGLVSIPSTLSVPAGATLGTTTVGVSPAAVPSVVTVTASLGSSTMSAVLTVALPPSPLAVSISPASVIPASVATGTVTVHPAAPPGGLLVQLSSSSPAVTLSSSVTIPEGAAAMTFPITAGTVETTTTAVITATAAGLQATATLTVIPVAPPPLDTDLAEGSLAGWTAFADPPSAASVSTGTTHVKSGTVSLGFVTGGGGDAGVRYTVPPGSHWDLRGVRFLTFWSRGETAEALQGAQPVVVLRGPAGSIRYQPAAVQTLNGAWRFHRVPLEEPGDWIVTRQSGQSLGDLTALEIHQSAPGAGMTVTYDGIAFSSEVAEDLAEGTAALWRTFASDGAAASVIDDAADTRSGVSALRLDTGSGFDTGIAFPARTHSRWDLTDVRTLVFWARGENAQPFQGNQPVVVLRSPGGSIRLEPGEVLLGPQGWRFFEAPLDGSLPWTRTQEGSPDLSNVNGIEIHGDTWGSGFRLYVDGVSVGRPLPLLVLPETSAPEGSSVPATIHLSSAAPAGGLTVLLETSDSAVASLPPSVFVPGGSRSAAFTVTTGDVGDPTSVVLTATDRGTSVRSDLRVIPSTDVASVSLGAASAIGGLTVTGTVTLGAPAGQGGVAVLLGSSDASAASVPAAILVPASSTTASFSVATAPVPADRSVTLTATAGGVPGAASLTVLVAPPPAVSAVTLSPATVSPGQSASLSVVLAAPAPLGGVDVALSATPPGLFSLPSTLFVPGGASLKTMSIVVPAAASPSVVTVTAAIGGSAVSAELTVAPPASLVEVSFSRAWVTVGEYASLTATLTTAAPAGGRTLTLSSSNPAALPVPATLSVPAGRTSAVISIQPPLDAPHGTVTVSASDGAITRAASVAVTGLIRPADLSFIPSTGFLGESITGTLSLTFAAPPGGYEVELNSSSPGLVSVPGRVVVPAGSISTTFQAVLAQSGSGGTPTIQATANGVTRSATVGVVTLQSPGISPSPAVSGMQISVQVSLSAAVPPGRVVEVALTSSVPGVVSVPPTVLIPAGASSTSFPVVLPVVATDTPVELTATALGAVKTLGFNIHPLKVASITARNGRTTIGACQEDDFYVETNARAPASGATILVSVENGRPKGGRWVSGSSPQAYAFDLPAGHSLLAVRVEASWGPAPRQLVTTARIGSSTASLSLGIDAGTVSAGATPSVATRGGTVRLALWTSGSETCVGASTIDAPATSSDPSVLPVPAAIRFVSHSEGLETLYWYADLPVASTAATGTTRIAFSALGSSLAVDVTVPDSTLSSLVVNPSAAPIGATVTGYIGLDTLAPAGGVVVMLESSDPAKATVPVSVLVPAGESTATFALTPGETATAADLTVTASVGAAVRATAFRALPSNAATIVGRIVDSSDYDVESPVSGAVASLTSGPGRCLTGSDGTYRLYAEPGPASLQLTAPGFLPFATEPLPLAASQVLDTGTHRARRQGGGSWAVSGNLVDPQGNPIYGAEGVLEGYDVSVSTDGVGRFRFNLPEPRRRYRMTFSKPGFQTWTEDFVDDSLAYFCPGSSSDCFVLGPSPRAVLDRAAFERPSAIGGSAVQLRVYIGGIPPYGEKISLTQATVRSPGEDTFVQTTVFPMQGGEFLAWPVTLPKVTVPTIVEYVLFCGGQKKSVSIEVVPQTVKISCSGVPTPTTTVSCSATLQTGPAPADGAVVSLTSSTPDLFTVPVSATVPSGQWTVSFPLFVNGLVFNDPLHPLRGTLKGRWAGGWDEHSVTVYRPDVSSLVFTPAATVGGGQVTGTIGLMGPAYPTGQTIVTLESTLSNITVPPTVTIAPGASTATFPITTTTVTQPTTGAIRARLTTLSDRQAVNPLQRSADLLLTLSGLGLVCAQTEPIGGYEVSCQVCLPGSPAPAGGMAIALASSSGVISVPASVTVPEGQFAKTFSVTSTPTVSTTSGVVRATLGEQVAEVTLTVRQPTLSYLGSDYPTTVEGGLRAVARVSLDGKAPAGGILVHLSSASAAVSLPATVLIPEDSFGESFDLTTAPVAALTEVVLSASSGSATVTRTFTLTPQTWRLSGLAPGRAVAGTAGIRLYGPFLPGNGVRLSGPVYSAAAPDTALCDEASGGCPALDLSGTVVIPPSHTYGQHITFTLPSSLSPGYYAVRARSQAGALSAEPRWLLVDEPSPTWAALPPEQHGLARPITSGQSVQGTFVENGDASGATNDFNLYYFVAAAGSRVSLRLERTDTSLPWEHPDSLDPQLSLIAPDGFVYENLSRQDVAPALDLNAELADLTLGQSGMWLIVASTSRGHGGYRLTYTMTPPGSVPPDQRILTFSGASTTAPVGQPARFTLAAFDPRGSLLSGASVAFQVSYPDPTVGPVQVPIGQSSATAVDGLAQHTLLATTPGAVDIRPNFTDAALLQSSAEPEAEALLAATLEALPVYQPLEHHAYTVKDVDPDGIVTLDLGPVKTFTPARPLRPRTEWKRAPGAAKALDARTVPAPEPEVSPEPRPLPPVENAVAASCTELRLFRFQAVNASDVKGPFTVTLEDLTPVAGQPDPPRPVGEKGIVGHRIEKSVRLRIIVKDRDGNEPPHPVLLRLSAAGPRPGTLVFDPDGTRKECRQGLLVWHDRDAQGNLIPNDLLEYRLGTLSLLPGVEPDPDHPGQVRPVWGVAEVLSIASEAITTTEATAVNRQAIPVRPQPGKPNRLVDWDGSPTDDGWEWWNSFYTFLEAGRRTVHVTTHNAYSLVDKYENLVWGYRDTFVRGVPAQTAVSLPFQDTTGPDFRAYAFDVKWWSQGGAMPVGNFGLALEVAYPADPDWPAGTVYADTIIRLQGGNQTHLKSYGRYEARYGLDDVGFPMSVSPGAKEAAIPRVGPPDFGAVPGRTYESPRRLSLLLVTGSEAPSTEEVFRAPHHPWEWQGGAWVERPAVPAPDPHVDLSSKPRLRLKLVNVNGVVQTAAGFKVHFCPRFDHEASPAGPEWACPTAPVASTNGVIDELRMNPGVVGSGDPPSPDAAGYLGLELTEAPLAPGTYYVYVESLDQDVKVRDQALLQMDDTPEGQYQGGFALCTVTAAEFLDANFQRIEPLSVVGPTNAYVRFTDPGEAGGSILVDVNSYDGDSVLDTAPDVSLTRVGRSGTFLSEPIELNPPWTADDPAMRAALAARPKKIRINPWIREKVEAIRRHPTTSIAKSKTVGPGGVLRFPVGLKLPLTLYRSFTFSSRQARYDLCSPQGGRPCGTDIIDPTSVTWRVEPIGVDVEGDTQIARLEVERNASPPQEFVRGIRISTGKAWVPGGVITVSASTGLQEVASAPVQVARPDSLGTYADITRDYEGTPVDLKKLIIDTADQYGIPPHYLAAQMYAESSFNPYAYRYEPTSQDFKLLVGDWKDTVVGSVRWLYSPSASYSRLGIRRGNAAEFLPSQTAPPDSLTPGTARIPGQEPPAIETFTFTADGSSTSYQVAGLNGDKIQLGVDVRRPGAVLREFAQDLLADCAGDALTLSEFCVDGDAGSLRFGLPPVGQQVVSFRRVKVLRDLPPPGDFGSLIGGAAEQQAAIDRIRLKNPLANVRPPASLSTTIRQWAIQRGTNPLLNNDLERWGELFSDSDLFTLIKRDPSFEVQGQWFGAASYGLLQLLPETVQTLYRNRAALSSGDAEFLRNTYYDPMTQNPLGRLFDPTNCVPMGAEILVRARVITEDQDPDPACTHKRNECTWRNIWSSRLCRFNTGGEGPCMYGNKIVFGADAKPPLVDTFVPRLNP